ncbi:3-hydroxyacyl-CoA dehydrogenase / enoyl-CoA hydratase / 3-hydroxybutyryl-CoA epimerase / enoyl-CoA isomerase [Oceanospirillum multiglobuliferum]|uniref:enoyl-CoA hydratase n=1 Tax=Oceanospirillum multiglobuliferum TaxID=64969 RepID=A0A1T4R5J8_9GAMM|nr:fatty acid oxidation complex subunit alpha FadB [Oceanospirillum multiglobuliferum]OPX55237.1 multifunctional fatty acid oxidation complex subunit alpha [Oceanospirillum multiglobuliferum]SKA10941.1 3-hydroxyacyl-CoA dehydrogenase / enoyl-CoA hydratase / 3-hydroxybutyryl-CoA epimerase / enoyl-CoA isomerase [Oceanospirillum multiglobuliferum]
MIYAGKAIRVNEIEGGIAELTFDLQGESVNKFNRATIQELGEATLALQAAQGLKGLVINSAKDVFIVGADITEFHDAFGQSEEELVAMNMAVHEVFNRVEDLPYPTVTAINGIALGGGFEICLCTDYRVASTAARVGLPEVKLGIIPGWGGTVRLPRIIGNDNAIEWICASKEKKAEVALKEGAVDALVAPEQLRAAAIDLIHEANSGRLNWQAKRQEKLEPLKLNMIESMMSFETAKGFVAGQAGPHYPAPLEAIKSMQKGAGEGREKAQKAEAKCFARMARTSVAQSLVGLFLNDQLLKKKAAAYEKDAQPVNKAAVLGAGIMGGGIAYQSASKGTPIMMKDIREDALQLGLNEAKKLLTKMVERKRMTPEKMADALNAIRPTLSYGDFADVDLVVEAVVENPKIKGAVLAELEGQVADNTIITSNTSTISISSLAENLKRPENFCGMHFFNPVHKMPLVEVIRGEKTSEKAIAATVAYAKKMGKTPVVVNDCPGFLVNRILFPYFGGFMSLIEHGADFKRVDKVMEKFGWPMGPAYLLDVVGMDTAEHANNVMAAGFPDRMAREGETALSVMFAANRLGQKNKQGFYLYEEDRKGRSVKVMDDSVYDLLKPLVKAERELTDDEIVARMMIPLCIETVRCLEDGIVATAAEADMGLIFGIGFPPFRGGALRYIDSIGLAAFCELADQYAPELGALYQPTEKMRAMAAEGKTFF